MISLRSELFLLKAKHCENRIPCFKRYLLTVMVTEVLDQSRFIIILLLTNLVTEVLGLNEGDILKQLRLTLLASKSSNDS